MTALCVLTWTMLSTLGVTGYQVYHTLTPGAYGAPAMTLTAQTVTCEQLGITADGRTHYFTVTALRTSGESAKSNEVSKFLASPTPTCLKYNKRGKCLQWS